MDVDHRLGRCDVGAPGRGRGGSEVPEMNEPASLSVLLSLSSVMAPQLWAEDMDAEATRVCELAVVWREGFGGEDGREEVW